MRVCEEHGSKCNAASTSRTWVCQPAKPDSVGNLQEEVERCDLLACPSPQRSWDLLIAFVCFDVTVEPAESFAKRFERFKCTVAVGSGLASPESFGLPASGHRSIVCFGRNGVQAASAVARFRELSEAAAGAGVSLKLKTALLASDDALLRGWQTQGSQPNRPLPSSEAILKRVKQYYVTQSSKKEVEAMHVAAAVQVLQDEPAWKDKFMHWHHELPQPHHVQVAAAVRVLQNELADKEKGLAVLNVAQRPKDALPLPSGKLPLPMGIRSVLVTGKKKRGRLTCRLVLPPEILQSLGYPADVMNLSMLHLSTALSAASNLPCAPAVIIAGIVCAELRVSQC